MNCNCKKTQIIENYIKFNGDSTITNKPWGFEIRWAESKVGGYFGKLIHVCSGKRLSLQYHNQKTETMFCIDGVGKLVHNNNIIYLIPGKNVHIESGTIHRLCADENNYVNVIEVSTSHEEVVRLEDDYQR